LGQEVIHEITVDHEQMWRGRGCVGRHPQDAVTVMDEHHRALPKVPEKETQGFKPLNPNYHIERGQLETVAVDDKRLGADNDMQIAAAAQAIEAVTIGHDDSQTCRGMLGDVGAMCRGRVNEIMSRSSVQ
jgi:hypothetical protein